MNINASIIDQRLAAIQEEIRENVPPLRCGSRG